MKDPGFREEYARAAAMSYFKVSLMFLHDSARIDGREPGPDVSTGAHSVRFVGVRRNPPRCVYTTGGRLVKHTRSCSFLFAERHLRRRLFGEMVNRRTAPPVPRVALPNVEGTEKGR